MENSTKRNIQSVLGVVLVTTLLRVGYMFNERRKDDAAPPPAPAIERELKSDDFVFLRSMHAYDVASAKKIEGMTVWVKAGNAVAYFRPSDRKKAVGTLAPIAKMKISKVAATGDQVMATFTFEEMKDPGPFVTPVGSVSKGDTNLFLDDMFYYDDPHKLYAHWPEEVWKAVERHEITEGMNEIQAGLAMGIGRGSGGDYGNRTLQYSHYGKTVDVMFRGNSAVKITEIKQ